MRTGIRSNKLTGKNSFILMKYVEKHYTESNLTDQQFAELVNKEKIFEDDMLCTSNNVKGAREATGTPSSRPRKTLTEMEFDYPGFIELTRKNHEEVRTCLEVLAAEVKALRTRLGAQ